MRFWSTLTKAIVLTVAFSSPVFASTDNPSTTTEIPPVEGPLACHDGTSPNWEQAKKQFIQDMADNGATYLGRFDNQDGSFNIVFDMRRVANTNLDTPIYLLVFDPKGCFVFGTFITEADAHSIFNIVLANAS